jgi:hypothetical protein
VGRWRNLINGGEFEEKGSRLRRWKRWYDDLSEVLETQPVFLHIAGVRNGIADLFSRIMAGPACPVERTRGFAAVGFSGGTSTGDPTQNHMTVDTVLEGGGSEIRNSDSEHLSPVIDLREFDYSDFLLAIKSLQSSDHSDTYKGKKLSDIYSAIPENLLAFTLVDGLLYYEHRLYIPPGQVTLGSRTVDARKLLIYIAHGPVHCGETRSIALLKKYWWPRLDRSVCDYVRFCHTCQLSRAKEGLYSRLTARNLMNRFDSIILDHTKAPLPGSNGETHVLVICDEFSRYVRFYPCMDLSVEQFLPHFLDWVGLFGMPRRVVCDNHSTFRAELWKRLLDFCDCEQLLPPVYYPRPQGQAEHHMSTLKRFIGSAGPRWPTQVNLLAVAHNSTPLQGSQVTPFDLTLGSTPRSLVDLMSWDVPAIRADNPSMDDYHKQLLDNVETAQEYHRVRVETVRQMSRDNQNLSSRFHQFSPGDEVIYVTSGALGRQVHGLFSIESISNAGTIFTLSNGSRVSLSQIVPYLREEGTTFRPPIHGAESFNPSKGAMMLVKRTDSYIDVGRCVDVISDIQTCTYNAFSYEGGKWVENESARRSCLLVDILDVGFKLTRGQFRAKDRRKWRMKGWDM